jgi:Flp pilus assembly protein TadG
MRKRRQELQQATSLVAQLADAQDGSVAIETTLAYMILISLVLAIVEFSLMGYTYSVVAEATRQGVRYASFHGTSSANCSGPSTGCGDSSGTNVANDVTTSVANLAGNVKGAQVSVVYPDGSSAPLSRILVQVTYTYAPMFNLPGFAQQFQVSSEGRIIY